MRKRNTSDRMKAKTKYFNQKKKKERRRKLKKDKKLNPNKYHKRKADLGVPNAAPFKQKVLDEALFYKQKDDEKEQFKKEAAKKLKFIIAEARESAKRKLPLEPDVYFPKEAKKPNLQVRFAEPKKVSEEEQFREALELYCNPAEANIKDARFIEAKTTQAAYATVDQVVSQADVIIQVLDARDPQGTRCLPLEKRVSQDPTKHLLFLLNKADLVPKDNLLSWLSLLRREAPAVAFWAAPQRRPRVVTSRQRLKSSGDLSSLTLERSGLQVLHELCKTFVQRSKSFGVSVGLVGLPNVGKASVLSLIQRLLVCEECGDSSSGSVGSIPEVRFGKAKKLFLLTRAGVALPLAGAPEGEEALRGVRCVGALADPLEAARLVWSKCQPQKLCVAYGIRAPSSLEELLAALGERTAAAQLSGRVDEEAAARRLLRDWNHGHLRHHATPPLRALSAASNSGASNRHLLASALLTEALHLWEAAHTAPTTLGASMQWAGLPAVQRCEPLGMAECQRGEDEQEAGGSEEAEECTEEEDENDGEMEVEEFDVESDDDDLDDEDDDTDSDEQATDGLGSDGEGDAPTSDEE